jgi:hypothetical protein
MVFDKHLIRILLSRNSYETDCSFERLLFRGKVWQECRRNLEALLSRWSGNIIAEGKFMYRVKTLKWLAGLQMLLLGSLLITVSFNVILSKKKSGLQLRRVINVTNKTHKF